MVLWDHPVLWGHYQLLLRLHLSRGMALNKQIRVHIPKWINSDFVGNMMQRMIAVILINACHIYLQGQPEPKKRPLSSTPRIVDNKRKHLEKPLSAAKRDEVLLRAAKEDIALKKQHMSNMQGSQNALVEMAKSISTSLNSLGKNVSDGLGLLAMALNPNVMQMANNSFGNIHNPSPLISQQGSQEFYPAQRFPSQQQLHMTQNPYQEQQNFVHASTSRMSASSNEANFGPQHPRYSGNFPNNGHNNMSSSNGKTYEHL